MGDIYWKKLNESPQTTFPLEIHRQAFEVLKAKIDLKIANIREEFKQYEKPSLCRLEGDYFHPDRFPNEKERHFLVGLMWSSHCEGKLKDYKGTTGFAPFSSFFNKDPFDAPWLSFDLRRNIEYANQCTDKRGKAFLEQIKSEDLSHEIRGIYGMDWDSDGDMDAAILLKTGAMIFFQQESCNDPNIS